MTGAVPGLGKSTFARALAAETTAALFEEGDIRADPAFETLMRSFESSGAVELAVLLDSASAFEPAQGVHVLDALFPYLPSLLVWSHDDATITAFFGDLASRLAPHRMVELHLRGDAPAALDRAVEREGDGWIEQLAAKYGIEPADAASHFEAAATRSVRLLATAPWPVHIVGVDNGPDCALRSAVEALSGIIP